MRYGFPATPGSPAMSGPTLKLGKEPCHAPACHSHTCPSPEELGGVKSASPRNLAATGALFPLAPLHSHLLSLVPPVSWPSLAQPLPESSQLDQAMSTTPPTTTGSHTLRPRGTAAAEPRQHLNIFSIAASGGQKGCSAPHRVQLYSLTS
jgi:hypothetical protein